jgi:malto-oligosyltrehalose trehalohydrolase
MKPEFAKFRLSDGAQCWGPRPIGGGSFLFQLWAPAESSISLRLNGVDMPMIRSEDGWHRLETSADYGNAYGFVLDDGRVVGDPASRQQVGALDGLSILSDADRYDWKNTQWRGRPWEETVVYEIHVGAFTEEGTFRSAEEQLPRLAELGITAVEIMPVAHFPGMRGWGYDGVLQFAPHNIYGAPDDFKAFIDAAHGLGIMVFLDVVYNHFGSEGNHLGQYAPGFFRKDVSTPWGDAIAYEKQEVRAYFLENVLYWLREFRLDGLRFDAIDQIKDESDIHILEQIARMVRKEISGRHVHLITENPANGTDLMVEQPRGRLYQADWNDDFHHALHVAVTGEDVGYFEPFKDDTWGKIKHSMAHGYLTLSKRIVGDNRPQAESLPPTAFIHFLQNHDQVGNRAFGDRLHLGIDHHVYRVLTELLLLSPQIPLLFMGDDHLSPKPFHFFADYTGEMAEAIRKNRPKEAANFGGFANGLSEADMPDPNDSRTFTRSKLDWDDAETEGGRAWAAHVHYLLKLRQEKIVPLLGKAQGYAGKIVDGPHACLFIDWTCGEGILQVRANLSWDIVPLPVNTGVRVFPEEQAPAGGVLPATLQVFIR